MKKLILFLISATIISCQPEKEVTTEPTANLNDLAVRYVKLGLEIGQYDEIFVDAYYGPDSLKPAVKKDSIFPKDRFLKMANDLNAELTSFSKETKNDTLKI